MGKCVSSTPAEQITVVPSIKSITSNDNLDKVSTFTAHTSQTLPKSTKSIKSKSINPINIAQWRLDLENGSKLDIYDNTYSKWYQGKVIQVKNQTNTTMQVKIRYDGYGSKYDEYIDVTSKRLAPLNTHTPERKKQEISIPTNKLSAYYKSINLCQTDEFWNIEPWRRDLQNGTIIDIFDTSCSKWYPGWIIEIDEETRKCKVHYDEYSSDYDEWIKIPSSRIAYKDTHTKNFGAFTQVTESSQVTSNKPWIDNLTFGSKIDIYDESWYSGHIVNFHNISKKIKVHFDGYNSDYEEWIERKSSRLAPFRTHTSRAYSKSAECETCERAYEQARSLRLSELYEWQSNNNDTLSIWICTSLDPYRTKPLRVAPEMPIKILKLLVEEKIRVPVDTLRLIFGGKQLSDSSRITVSDYGITKDSILHITLRLHGGGLKGVRYDDEREVIQFGYGYGNKEFEISSFHVSCQSDKFNGQNMVGFVLYSYDDNTDFYLNDIHCKSGYLVLKLHDNIKDVDGKGVVHGACYKSIFDEDIDDKVVGGGFAYYNGKWKFNSFTFNTASQYHDDQKAMHIMEQQCILAVIENWKQGIQNTFIKDIANNYDGSCNEHGFFVVV